MPIVKRQPSGDRIGRCDVAVVGGGIAGCATGHHLAQAGVDVVVLERFELNTQASGRNAGSLHGQIQHEPFIQLGDSWAREFLPALRLLVDSVHRWRTLSDELGVDLEVVTNGGLLVARTAAQLDGIRRKAALEKAAGFEVEVLGRDELHRVAPYLSDDMVGGQLSWDEGKANSLLAAPAFAASVRRAGGRVLTRTAVHEITREGSGFRLATSAGELDCGRVVVTTGTDLPELLGPFGCTPPVSAEPVQVSVTEAVAPLVTHLVYYAGGRLTMKQTRTGSLLIGGGWPADVDGAGQPVVSAASLRSNLRVAMTVVPAVSDALVLRSWVGVGNGTPDHRPLIGEVPGTPGLFAGLFPYMGLTAGPLLGQLLSDLAQGRSPDRDLSPFALDRF